MSVRTEQKGFSIVHSLFIIVIIILAGFAGWRIWDNHKLSNEVQTSAVESAVTKDWTPYRSVDGKFSVRYPKTWVTAPNPEKCDPTILLVAPNKKSVGECSTDNPGEVIISSAEGDSHQNYAMTSTYTNVKKKTVKVDGVSGTRWTGTLAAGTTSDAGVAGTAGTKEVRYVFYANHRTIAAVYTQVPNYPVALDDFTTMVTQTLTFN